jgi:hypothetical protein
MKPEKAKDPIAELVIDELGGTSAVARLCGIKPPSVTGWREHGIPRARRQFLELLRPDVFAACTDQATPTANHKTS